jgi:hypothetical protein
MICELKAKSRHASRAVLIELHNLLNIIYDNNKPICHNIPMMINNDNLGDMPVSIEPADIKM